MTVNEAIERRRSVRKYKKESKIPQEHIELMLKAAMMAPSAGNTRPWEFVVVEREEIKEQIVQASPFSRAILDAPIAIIVCGLPDKQQGPMMEGFWPQDCGAATENILLQATELGYGSCWCGAYPRMDRVEGIQKVLGISSIPVSIIAVGQTSENPEARGYYDEGKVKYFR